MLVMRTDIAKLGENEQYVAALLPHGCAGGAKHIPPLRCIMHLLTMITQSTSLPQFTTENLPVET